MSTVNLECELVQDDDFFEYKTEFVDDEDTQPNESNINTTECGRIILHLDKNIYTFNCFFCESSFSEISEFTEHISCTHIELSFEDGKEWETSTSTCTTVNVEITPVCPIKDEVSIDELESSKDDVEEYPPKFTEEVEKPLLNYPHKCEYCEKSYRYRSKLREHLTIHTGELPFKCDQCPKAFRTNSILRFHRAVHNTEDSYNCHHCDQTFNQKRYLQMHLKYHFGEQTFPCTICGKTHRTSNQLKVHMTKHTLKKDYVCEICGARYRLRQHLVIHLKQKHENKRNFRCDECDKAFNTIAFLNQHKLCHSKKRNHICNKCGVGFVWRKNLLQHMKLHTGTKNYKCEHCDKAFAQKSGLITHVKIHGN